MQQPEYFSKNVKAGKTLTRFAQSSCAQEKTQKIAKMNKDENKKKRKKKEQKYIGDGVLSLVLNHFFLVVGLF